MKTLKIKMSLIILGIILMPHNGISQQRLVKILVSTPYMTEKLFLPIGDVMAGSIIRELKRAGGVEIIDREISEEYIIGVGGDGWVATRGQAIEVGKSLGADIVLYSAIRKDYNSFYYQITFIEVNNNVIQRTIKGSFLSTDSASEIGRIMKKEVDKIRKFIPLPSELDNPGASLREVTIDPDQLPKSYVIDDFPAGGRNGLIEQILTYYRVFPGELEYARIAGSNSVMDLSFQEAMDPELTKRLNKYNLYGDFAIRHNLQAFYIQNCSTEAINVLLANKVPVLMSDDIFLGYYNLLSDGYCIFNTLSNRTLDSIGLTHRERLIVMFIVPYPGKKGGISREYLESAIGRYKDEWGETPVLVEIENGMLDMGTRVSE
ncbi:hypothetical protein ACFL6K_00195 [Candidatus Latescibacterota bacterium]